MMYIRYYLMRNMPIWIIEPSYMYHHKRGITFFPQRLPAYIERLIQKGRISVLKSDLLNSKEIYQLAADRACEVIESVYPAYKKEHKSLINYVSEVLNSPIAENIFKKKLCDRLAEFYSLNILMQRIEDFFPNAKTVFFPSANVYSYLYIKKIFSDSSKKFFESANIKIPFLSYIGGSLRSMGRSLKFVSMILAQTIASSVLGRFQASCNNNKKYFTYGVTIVGPRQLRVDRRGPDFIIDNKKILKDEVAFFPLMNFSKEQNAKLRQLSDNVFMLPQPGKFFSNVKDWAGLLRIALKLKFLTNGEELYAAIITFLNYFRWKKILETVQIKHFITHCDFGIGHIGRNIALVQSGVQTWYFTDSMNFLNNFMTDEAECAMRHPFWTYLYYDHFVTWDAFLAEYFKSHPGTFEKKRHIVGCLWSGLITEKNKMRKATDKTILKDIGNKFILAAYDTTYSNNGLTSYTEGLLFAEHLIKLSEEFEDIYIFLKEKKDRSIHKILDSFNGHKLLDLYDMMDRHSRITICSNKVDASDMISVSDIVISFPFTSTTFEALSVNRPAIWHDPMGYYRDTPYGKIDGVTTHGYEDLKKRILDIKGMKLDEYKNPIPFNSSMLDPFRDGKAVDRFRDLLVST